MNLLNFLKRKFDKYPDIKPGQFKHDVRPQEEIKRCALNMTDSGCPGSGHGGPSQLMYPNLFRNKKKVRKDGK